MDARTHANACIYKHAYQVHGSNFHGSQIICENHENWIPRKFPTLWYVLNSEQAVVDNQHLQLMFYALSQHRNVINTLYSQNKDVPLIRTLQCIA